MRIWLALLFAACNVDNPLPGDSTDCTVHHTALFAVPRTENTPQMKLALFQCQRDTDSCTTLCNFAMHTLGITETMTACSVAYDAQVLVAVSYDTMRTDPSCQPQFAPGAAGMGQGG